MSDYTLTVDDGDVLDLEYTEAKIKPEQTKAVTPAYEAQTVLPDAGMTLGRVDVAAIPDPTDTMDIAQNGEYDVRRYGTARVNVPQGVFPAGSLPITQNGDYDVTNYAAAAVTVEHQGLSFDTPDADGYPTRARILGVTSVPNYLLQRGTNDTASVLGKITALELGDGIVSIGQQAFERLLVTELTIPASVTTFGGYWCRYMSALTRIEFLGNVQVAYYWFMGTGLREFVCHGQVTVLQNANPSFPATMTLYDLRGCDAVPVIANASYIGHANGCVIRVKRAMLNAFQTDSVWGALTDVIWEGV